MKPRFARTLFIILLLIWAFTVPASAEIEYQFRRVSPPGGFTLSPVRKISQDRYGFIWFVTNHKLYQYNTQEFLGFSSAANSGQIHISNTMNCFLIDSKNKKWVGTSVGLNLFNDAKGRLEFFELKGDDRSSRLMNIREIKQSGENDIWLIENVALAHLDTVHHKLRYVYADGNKISVNSFCFDQDYNIYAVNNNREIYFINTKTFVATRLNFGQIPVIIHGIFMYQNTLWISSNGEGLIHYDLKGNILHRFEGKKGIPDDLPSNRVRDVIRTKDGKIWIATYKGLVTFDNNKLSLHNSEFENPFSLPDNSIMSLFEDKQEEIWIGTWRGGLAYRNQFINVFEKYQNSPYRNSITDNIINTIGEDKNGLIWIGTESHGINTFDENDRTFQKLKVKGPNNNSPGNIKKIYHDPDGNTWVGTFRQGLFRKLKGEKEFKQFLLTSENVYDILSDTSGLWIATFNKGLYYYRFSDKSLRNYSIQMGDPNSIRNNQLRALYLDDKGALWIITESGLCRKPRNEEWFQPLYFDEANSGETTQINTITGGKDGVIWAGTNNGLLRISEDGKRIQRFPITLNMKEVPVYGIVAQSAKQLWLGTNTGIFSFYPETGKYLNYSSLDGIPGNLFNPGSVLKSQSGKIYFGGTSGLVAFDPSKIRVNTYIPEVFITKLLIDYKEVKPNEKGSPLESPVYELEKLKLGPSQNSFSIEFVALNYLNPQKNQFRYRLKGFDKDWVESGFVSKANYTNISPGHYDFEVMACNNDGVWNTTPTRLAIVVLPPFYKSWPAYLIYLLTVMLLGWSAWKFVIFRSNMIRQVEMERLRRIQEEELHQVKLDFYTNISHELRTPLTLITGPLDALQSSGKFGEQEYDMLSLIKRNSTRLLRLINQLLEFRKLEFGKKELLVSEIDVNAFVHELFDCFTDIAKQKRINYTFTGLHDYLVATFDAEKLDKIIFNIISNAFKNTPERGTILVEVSSGKKSLRLNGKTGILIGELISDDYVQISVEDNGVGIEPDLVPKIFDRFYQIDGSAGSGSGIGLHLVKQLVLMHGGEIEVESAAGKGSTFKVRIPHNLASFQKLKNVAGIQINAGINGSSKTLHETSGMVSFSDEREKQPEKNRKNEFLILVVEDNSDLKKFVSQILSDSYRIITAEDGREGLQKARLYLPDMIISDVLMPNMNGVEFCRELKNDINTSHIPVIMLTALTSSKNKVEGLSSGADAYIEKPFDGKVLMAQMESIFKARERMQKKYSTSLAGNLLNEVPETLDQKLILKAIRYVEENITNENLDIENLAGFLNMSRSSLHRKLKALTNKSASDFIRTIRLERAARLMKEGHNNIDEVSVMVGFNSHSYFTRAFKDHFAKTPSEFLSAHQD